MLRWSLLTFHQGGTELQNDYGTVFFPESVPSIYKRTKTLARPFVLVFAAQIFAEIDFQQEFS